MTPWFSLHVTTPSASGERQGVFEELSVSAVTNRSVTLSYTPLLTLAMTQGFKLDLLKKQSGRVDKHSV
jgi:hypothetical protein